MKVFLDDGRLIDSSNFEIEDWEERRFEAGDKWAFKWAMRAMPDTAYSAVVIARRTGVLVGAVAEDKTRASTLANHALTRLCSGDRRRFPRVRTLALLNFTPSVSDTSILSGVGVDVVCLKDHFEEKESGAEAYFKEQLLGPKLNPAPWTEGRIIERRIFVQPRWDRMNKIYRSLNAK
jgi:hypothetical protein